MNKLLVTASIVASSLVPTAANAQALPTAIVALVDLDKVTAECTACKTAAAALRGQITSLEARQKSLATPIETEGKAIQASFDALKGAQPDAALTARAKAWDQKRQNAAQQIQQQQQQIQRNQLYVRQQIVAKLGPIYQQVMQRRGATLMVEREATLAAASSIDVTNDVLTALNAAMPTLSTTAPAQTQPAPSR